jgi:hypothetical protein
MLAKVKTMAFNVASAGIGNVQHAEGSGCQLGTGKGSRCVCFCWKKENALRNTSTYSRQLR